MDKPVIEFEKYEILNIVYEKIEDYDIEEKNIETSVSIGFTEDLQAGKVEIDVNIIDPQQSRFIRVIVRGLFIINDGLDEEKVKVYLAQNGTAILYPYVRSIVSMISTMDSESAVILPTINTVQ